MTKIGFAVIHYWLSETVIAVRGNEHPGRPNYHRSGQAILGLSPRPHLANNARDSSLRERREPSGALRERWEAVFRAV